MGQNIIEKIVQKFTVDSQQLVYSGDYITISPQHVMTHDNTGAVIPKFMEIGAAKIANPRQVVCTLDHNIQDKSPKNLQKYQSIQDFCKKMGIDFYPAGRGIGHQIMCEEGYAWPGTMVVASDSHANMYGGIGCLGTPVVRTDAAAIWATGKTWWQVPPVAQVELQGKLSPGVSGKDVIIALCGYFNHDEVLNYALEFSGDGVAALSIEQRLTIANMTTEWGALAGVFPIDETTVAWLKERSEIVNSQKLSDVASNNNSQRGQHPRFCSERIANLQAFTADNSACYAKRLTLDLATVQPYVSGPNTVKQMTPIAQIREQRIKIDKAYLVSCVNSRVDDLHEAAKIINAKKIAPGVKFYISAASSEVQAESENLGDWQKLVAAGAIALPPGCGPCIGLGEGILEDGEVGISATNRNFKGRMGSKKADVYLASPAVVSASAISGYIDFPGEFDDLLPQGIVQEFPVSYPVKSIDIIAGFPELWQGELVLCPVDNLNTDGIYPGKYTYIDDLSPEQQAKVVMENYDPQFQQKIREGDFVVGGFNFGTGSSREQAATALKYKGVRLVIAGSFSETYKRNALNNGFLSIEIPELVKDLRQIFQQKELTIRTNINAQINFNKSQLEIPNKIYNFQPLGASAQQLIVSEGLVNWVCQQF